MSVHPYNPDTDPELELPGWQDREVAPGTIRDVREWLEEIDQVSPPW